MSKNTGLLDDDGEHELSYYIKDKVKLMKEVLKLIKPKKIKSMAPDCIKERSIVEINSMLLEELLGISNKRLQYIFKGENVDRETSSSDSEDIDVISLDDISDEDIVVTLDQSESNLDQKPKMSRNINPKVVKVKTEKRKKTVKDKNKKLKTVEQNSTGANKNQLMSVLELLELQARARAIRSQLAIENESKADETSTSTKNVLEQPDDAEDSDAIIIDSPEFKEIVITSSDSENEESNEQLLKECVDSTLPNESADTACNDTANGNEPLNIMPSTSQEIEPNSIDLTTSLVDEVTEISTSSKTNVEERQPKGQKIKLIRSKTSSTISKVAESSTSKGELVSSETNVDNSDPGDKLEFNSATIIVKQEGSSKNLTAVRVNSVNECDDEIVINLDDDEMDGIENV